MLLKDEAVGLGLSFDPLVIVSDFELAMVQASTMSFSNTPPWLLLPLHASNLEKGMLTNIAVRLNSLIITFLNLSMQVQALGLATEYRNPDGEVKPFVQLMASVAFCPLTYVRPAWLAFNNRPPTSQEWMSWLTTSLPPGSMGISLPFTGTTSTNTSPEPTIMLKGGTLG